MYGQCDCEPADAVPFLDTKCSIKNGEIVTDLYKKPTDKNQYLLTDSCHPAKSLNLFPIPSASEL